jgi:hypothetical protein
MNENNNWEYARGHKPKGEKTKGKSPKTKKAPKAVPDVMMVTLSIDLTEARLDQMWAALDIGSKGAAIQHTLLIEAEA